MSKIDKSFISDIDFKLAEFNQCHDKSASQIHEINKARKVANRRDRAIPAVEASSKLWDGF